MRNHAARSFRGSFRALGDVVFPRLAGKTAIFSGGGGTSWVKYRGKLLAVRYSGPCFSVTNTLFNYARLNVGNVRGLALGVTCSVTRGVSVCAVFPVFMPVPFSEAVTSRLSTW